MGHKIFPCTRTHGGQVKVMSEPSVSCIPFSLVASAFYLHPKLTLSTYSCRLPTGVTCQWTQVRLTGLFGTSLYAFLSMSVYVYNFILINKYNFSFFVSFKVSSSIFPLIERKAFFCNFSVVKRGPKFWGLFQVFNNNPIINLYQ